MYIFGVYGKVTLTKRPSWLKTFQKKYHWSHEPHVTLKQACFIAKEHIPIVIDKLTNFFSGNPVKPHQIQIKFKRLIADEEDGTIMINANHNLSVLKLHKQILTTLKEFNIFVFPHAKKWEQQFQPHFTIVGDLHKSQFEKALKELQHDYACEGIIKQIVLSVVERRTINSRTKPRVTKIYTL